MLDDFDSDMDSIEGNGVTKVSGALASGAFRSAFDLERDTVVESAVAGLTCLPKIAIGAGAGIIHCFASLFD